MTPSDFIAAIAPAAQASMAITKVPAGFVIAQGALESGWGGSLLAVQARNLFGVKADPSWRGDTFSLQTREFLNGAWVMVPALWRKYPDWQGCMDDHAAFFIKNRRYAPAFAQTSSEGFARAVAAAGYATDPGYADKVVSIIRGRNLAKFDT